MKCEKCKEKEATFFYEETVNGKTRALHLCQDCAAEMKASGELGGSFGADTPFSLFPTMPSLLGGLFGAPGGTARRTRGAKTCPGCGTTWESIAENGKVSCPKCYETFGEELSATLRQMHGNVTHAGRAPAKRRAVNEKKRQLESLRGELKAAIQAEDFEHAAELRDRIRSLEEN